VLGIAFIAFFVLLIAGVWMSELSIKQALIFVGVWAIGLGILNFFGLQGGLFVGLEVLLDIILIMMLFGGDIRIRRAGVAWP